MMMIRRFMQPNVPVHCAIAIAIACCVAGVHAQCTLDGYAKLLASDGASEDHFAHSVSICGHVAVVGVPYSGVDYSGAAYIYQYENFTWVEKQKLTASDAAEGDWFGQSVDIDGDWIIVGAPFHDANGGEIEDAGAAYVFRRDDNGTPADPTDDVWLEEPDLLQPDVPKAGAF